MRVLSEASRRVQTERSHERRGWGAREDEKRGGERAGRPREEPRSKKTKRVSTWQVYIRMRSWGRGSLAPVLKRFRVEGGVRGSEGTEFLWDLTTTTVTLALYQESIFF